jgi:hypothetical protein
MRSFAPTLLLTAFLVTPLSFAQTVVENQYYTAAEVFESAPVYGKTSIECITCPNVLLGYKLGIRLIQKTNRGDVPIVFDTVSKTPVTPGTWVKVALRMDLVVPIKNINK